MHFYKEEEDKTITAMNADAFSFATAPNKSQCVYWTE